jgi:hypothetical protein
MYEFATTIARRGWLSPATDVRAGGLAHADRLARRALAAYSRRPRVQRGTRSRITSSGRPARSVASGTAGALPLIAMRRITVEASASWNKTSVDEWRCAQCLSGRTKCRR